MPWINPRSASFTNARCKVPRASARTCAFTRTRSKVFPSAFARWQDNSRRSAAADVSCFSLAQPWKQELALWRAILESMWWTMDGVAVGSSSKEARAASQWVSHDTACLWMQDQDEWRHYGHRDNNEWRRHDSHSNNEWHLSDYQIVI